MFGTRSHVESLKLNGWINNCFIKKYFVDHWHEKIYKYSEWSLQKSPQSHTI